MTDQITELMNNDNLTKPQQTYILNLFNTFLQSEEFIKLIKLDVQNIMQDRQFTISDLPALLHLIINIINFKNSSVNIAHKISVQNLKYIVYGLLIHSVSFDNKQSDELFKSSLELMYSSLWSLVVLSVNTIETAKSGCC